MAYDSKHPEIRTAYVFVICLYLFWNTIISQTFHCRMKIYYSDLFIYHVYLLLHHNATCKRQGLQR